jgi:hypothetical protein
VTEPTEFLKGKPSAWKFVDDERELFDRAPEMLPTLKLANIARRTLADVCHQLSQRVPNGPLELKDVSPDVRIQAACLHLGIVVVREMGAAVSLISCGYEREALGPGRTVLEAMIRGRQAQDDPSGEVAMKLLRGQRPGGLKSVAHRYGHKNEIEFLDHFAHADLLSLDVLVTRVGDDPIGDLEMRPRRGTLRPVLQLFILGQTAAMMNALVCETFGVGWELPAFLANELAHYRDNPIPPPL